MEGRMFWLVSLLFSLFLVFLCGEEKTTPFSLFLYLSLSLKNPLTQSSINPIYINFSFPFSVFPPFCFCVFLKEIGWWVVDLIQIAALQLLSCVGNGDLGSGFLWDEFFAGDGAVISGPCSSAMEYDSGIPMSVTEGHSSALAPSLREDALWQMNLGSGEIMGSGSYPVRPGEPDCSYYIRTGLCRFGATCRFNHPPNRELAIATARMKGEFPERIGQPECQYYLKTGTCKFGATCKFHHPRDKAGIAGRVALNILGYPLRPSETECAYYLRTGQCKFGNTCKFHHPQPTNMMVSLRGSPIYPTVQSPTPGQQSYPGGSTNWSRASFIPSPRWQGPSSYASLILPQGVLSVPGWNAFNDQLGSVSSSESPQQTRENVFPERPGQPECQFYMKTGDCKFGAVCRFHHPRERVLPAPDCVLSPIGLPLRPGEPLCIFYSRYGICKFGPSCKFDHPMGIFTYNLSAASSANAPVQHLFGTSSGTTALNLSSEGLVEAGSAKPRRLSISESREMPSDDENDAEG